MRSISVLIVDDDEDFADGIAEILEMEGCEVGLAHSAEEGIAAAVDKPRDVVLIDIGLPGMSGVECLSRIRQATPGARCYLLTGYRADQVAARGVEPGSVEILTKPIEPAELLRLINAAAAG
jgi:DNA-binding response OmpR family regulator